MSPKINYGTLRPINKDLANSIQAKQLARLNKLALPVLVVAIVLLMQSLFFKLVDDEYAHFSIVRHTVFVILSALWYFLRKHTQGCCHFIALAIYVSHTVLAFWFPFVNISGFDTILVCVEISKLLATFTFASLVFVPWLRLYLFCYVPVFLATHLFLAYFIVKNSSDKEEKHAVIFGINFASVLAHILVTFILIYR